MKKAAVALVLLISVLVGAYALTSKGNNGVKTDAIPKTEQNNNAEKKPEAVTPKEESRKPDTVKTEEKETKVEEISEKLDKEEISTSAGDKEAVDNSEGKSRPEAFYIEELIFNFSSLYTAAVNKENIEIAILNNVIIAQSEFYNYVKGQIEGYKKQKATIKFETFDIKSIKDSTKDKLDITVNQVLSVTIEGKTEERNETVVYTVQFDNDRMGIVSHKKIDN